MDDKYYVQKKVRELMNKSRPSKCLHPKREECSEKIIKAHSIQNNRILNFISENGKVISMRDKFSPIGRGVATTFSGFCSKHDNQLFVDIEDIPYLTGNMKQNFLFSYRALCYEMIAKETAKNLHFMEEEALKLYRQ